MPIISYILILLLSGPGAAPGPFTQKAQQPAAEAKPKPVVVYITRTGKRYHRETCRYLHSKIKTDVTKATEAGYTPCKVCKPPRSSKKKPTEQPESPPKDPPAKP